MSRPQTTGMSTSEPWRTWRTHTYSRFCDKAVLWAEAKQSEDNKKGKGNSKGEGKPADKNKDDDDKEPRQEPHPTEPNGNRREKEREITNTSIATGEVSIPTTVTDGTTIGRINHREELPPQDGRTGADTGD